MGNFVFFFGQRIIELYGGKILLNVEDIDLIDPQKTKKTVLQSEELDEKIKDVEGRLPAHGIKPPIMTELFELEDEREAVFERLKSLRGTEPDMEAS